MLYVHADGHMVEHGDALTCVLALLERLTHEQLDVLKASAGAVQRRRALHPVVSAAEVYDLGDVFDLMPPFAVDGQTVPETDEDGDEVLEPTPFEVVDPVAAIRDARGG
jgi:hypothetical protein